MVYFSIWHFIFIISRLKKLKFWDSSSRSLSENFEIFKVGFLNNLSIILRFRKHYIIKCIACLVHVNFMIQILSIYRHGTLYIFVTPTIEFMNN
jgi:hypothetical protein